MCIAVCIGSVLQLSKGCHATREINRVNTWVALRVDQGEAPELAVLKPACQGGRRQQGGVLLSLQCRSGKFNPFEAGRKGHAKELWNEQASVGCPGTTSRHTCFTALRWRHHPAANLLVQIRCGMREAGVEKQV
jgi:hypothetical protein